MLNIPRNADGIISPGFYLEMPNADYHSSDYYGSSNLNRLTEVTPQRFLYERKFKKNEPTDAMKLGSMVHTLLLEPHLFDTEFVIEPVVNKRTKAGREEIAQFNKANVGKTVVNPSSAELAQQIQYEVLRSGLYDEYFSGTINEASLFWREQSTMHGEKLDLPLRVRPDAINKRLSALIDVKTTDNASFASFQRTIVKRAYHMQAAMYMWGVNRNGHFLDYLDTKHVKDFIFFCVETEAPYGVAVYKLDGEFLNMGAIRLEGAVARLQRAINAGFPGYPDDLRILDAPRYADYSPQV